MHELEKYIHNNKSAEKKFKIRLSQMWKTIYGPGLFDRTHDEDMQWRSLHMQ